MKTRRIDFAYTPLDTLSSIEVIGSVPNEQSFDSTAGTYAPDYTLSGSRLVLQPHICLYDKKAEQSREVTADLGSGTWYWTEIASVGDGVTTKTIVNSDTETSDKTGTQNYELTTTGANKGRIAMKRNVPVGGSITLMFQAEYADAASNETYKFRETVIVTCKNESSIRTLSIDRPTTNMWNPFRHPMTMTFNAYLKVGNVEESVSNRAFYWEKRRGNNEWSEIGSDTHDDFGWTVTNNGATYTQNMKYIGEKMDMRVRVKYGNLSTAQIDDSLTVYFCMVRRVPDFDYDYTEIPDNIERNLNYIYPKIVVQDNEGMVDNAEEHLAARWYTGAGQAVGNPTMSEVAYGFEPRIETSKINANGMVLGLEVKDRGNFKKMYYVDDQNVAHYVTQVIDGVEKLMICKTTK